jgi:hypothetical protein
VIANKDGEIAGHLRQATAFGFTVGRIPVRVDWSTVGAATIDPVAWAAEYDRNVAPAARRAGLIEVVDWEEMWAALEELNDTDDVDDPDDVDVLDDFTRLAHYRLRAEDYTQQASAAQAPVTYGPADAPAPRLSDNHGPVRRRRNRR